MNFKSQVARFFHNLVKNTQQNFKIYISSVEKNLRLEARKSQKFDLFKLFDFLTSNQNLL